MKVIIFKEVPKHKLNDSAKNKRENITFQTNNNFTELITELQSLKENFFHCKRSLTKRSNAASKN